MNNFGKYEKDQKFFLRYQIFRLFQVFGSFAVIGVVSNELPSESIQIWLLMGTIINLGNYVDLGIAGMAIDSVKRVNTKPYQIKNYVFWSSIIGNSKRLSVVFILSSLIASYFFKDVASFAKTDSLNTFLLIWLVSFLTIFGSILSSYFIAMGTIQLFTSVSLIGVLLQFTLASIYSLSNSNILTFITLLSVPNTFIILVALRNYKKYYIYSLKQNRKIFKSNEQLIRKDFAAQFQALQLLVMLSSLIFPLYISEHYSANDSNSYQMLFRITFLAASVSGLLLPNLWASSTSEPFPNKGLKLINFKRLIRDRLLIPTLMLLSIPALFIFDFFPSNKYTVPTFKELILWYLISATQYYLAKFYYTCLANESLNILILSAAIPLFIVTLPISLGQTFSLVPVELLFTTQFLQIICFISFFAIGKIQDFNAKQG